MNIIRFVVFTLISGLSCLFSPFTYGHPKTTITFVTENLPPYQMLIQGEISGFATEIITEALKQTDFDYQIKLYPWSRSYNYAQKKSNTCIYSIARTPNREPLFQWIQPIATSYPAFIGLKYGKDIQINSLDEAKKYITAVIRDDVAHQILVKNGFKEFKHFYVVNNSDSLLKLLITRKNIDLIMTDPLTIPYRALYKKIDGTLFASFYQITEEKQSFYLACSKSTSADIITALNKAMIAIKNNGVYQKIIDKWSFQYRGILKG